MNVKVSPRLFQFSVVSLSGRVEHKILFFEREITMQIINSVYFLEMFGEACESLHLIDY